MKTTRKIISSIRKWMIKNQIDAFIIPHDDEYLSEYIPIYNERLAWVTNFTGSAGIAIITHNNAYIFIDGRYTVQVKQQVDESLFKIMHVKNNPFIPWIKNNLNNKIIGYDPRLHRIKWLDDIKDLSILRLKEISENPIDILWDKRPKIDLNKVLLLDQRYTGKSSVEKRSIVSQLVKNNNCDAVFITQLDSIAWLLNIRGNDVPCNPVTLCHGILYETGDFDLFIDKKKIPEGFAKHVGKNVVVHATKNILQELKKLKGKTVQIDPNTSNIWSKNLLNDSGCTVKYSDDPCSLEKACKNEVEIKGMKECHKRDAIAVCNFLAWVYKNIELDKLYDEGVLADKLDSFREQLNLFKGLSFNTISAAGPNAAMCHYNHKNHQVPGKIKMNSVYLFDSGGQYLDGTTDITRTIAIGEPSQLMIKTFTLVLKGHIALSLAKFPEGIAGQHLDTFARQYLWDCGYDFEHGTGHGVGSYLNVHEGPQSIGKGANNVPLKEGMVLSNEPGYYEENSFGIRCENLIFVKKFNKVNGKNLLGFENLTFVPFDKKLIDVNLLSTKEKKWINEYHIEVLNKIGPLLEFDVQNWLKNATKPIS